MSWMGQQFDRIFLNDSEPEIFESDKFHKLDKYYLIYVLMMETLTIKKIATNTLVEKERTETEVIDVSS